MHIFESNDNVFLQVYGMRRFLKENIIEVGRLIILIIMLRNIIDSDRIVGADTIQYTYYNILDGYPFRRNHQCV